MEEQELKEKYFDGFDFDPLNLKDETTLYIELSKYPDDRYIRNRNGRSYLPISYVEAQLRRFFGPMGFQVRNFRWSTVINEQVGSLELWVRNPITKEWHIYEGAAAVQIQLKKNSQAIDVQSKIINSMEKMHPNLKSRCITNAAKSLGRAFGADIGRKPEDQETISREILTDLWNDIKTDLEAANTIEDVERVQRALPSGMAANDKITGLFESRYEMISNNKLKKNPEALTLFNGGNDER